MNKIIYRFTVNGYGIYTGRWQNSYIDDLLREYECDDAPRCPAPVDDQGLQRHRNKLMAFDEKNGKFLFGFNSLPMLTSWFPMECIEDLLDIGGAVLNIITLPPDSIFSSEKQCLFAESAVIKSKQIKSFAEFQEYLSNPSV